jgi:WD40 repeat protein
MTSATEDELTHLKELAAVLQRRRRVLEIQRAHFGDLVPAAIVLELEDTERQLAQIQVDMRRLRPIPADVHSPYLGLLTFQEDDSSYFFGRDALIGELLRKTDQTSFLAVFGPSGSGKSSVVRAGLLPVLKRGALPGSDQWYYLPPLKPGARPLDALATSLAAEQVGKLGEILAIREALRKSNDALLLAAGGLCAGHTDARFVVVVDQAEELWTLAPTEPAARTAFLAEQQQPFIQTLRTAARAPDQSVLIILTMRADFLHRALEHPELAPLVREHTVMVQPQSHDELRESIIRPTELAGGGFEPGLVDTLVEQTIGQLGALPLLEYTLLELWKERRPDGTLTWEAFQRIGGGVEGGLARRADTIFAQKYTPEQQAELRAVLVRLIQPGEGTADTRRRVPLDELVPAGGSSEAIHALLKPLADERLITTDYNPASDEETVEVSHEALIRAWPALGRWITTARADLRLHIQLGEAAREWVTNGENPDLLWSGFRLANVEAWLERARPRLNERDQHFLATSRARRQAELEATEAVRQRELDQARALAASALRLRRRALYLAGALIASLIAAASAGWYWYRATTAGEEAYRSAQAASMAEQRAFAQYLVAKAQTRYDENPSLGLRLAIEGLDWLPENDSARSDLISITVQLANQGRLQKLASDGSAVISSPDNTTFVLERGNAPSELRRASDGTRIATFTDATKVQFSPDGSLFVVVYDNQRYAVNKPNELRRADGSIVTTFPGIVSSVTFSPDSRLLVVGYDLTGNELRRADGSIITTFSGHVPDGAFSPDSRLFVVMYGNKRTELRRADGSIVNTFTLDVQSNITGVQPITFSPDSSLFVVSLGERLVELRRADGSIIRLTDSPATIDFSPDSSLFVVAYDKTPAELRRADGSIITILATDARATGATFSPDSSMFLMWHEGGSAELRRRDGHIIFLTTSISNVTFNPDGSLFVVSYVGRPGELRRADTTIIATLTSDIQSVTFSPDGSLFVVPYAPYYDTPNELRRADGSIVTTFPGIVSSVTFSPDNSLFIVAYDNKPPELWAAQGAARRLVTLTNLNSFTFDSKALRFIVQHTTGQLYMLDREWLRASVGTLETLPKAEIIERICTDLLSQFDEKELQPYLGNRTAKACR